jgi:hypothetical protein
MLMARAPDDTAVTWTAFSSAVALLTSLRARSQDSQADLIGTEPPEHVVTALAIVSTALLEALTPDAGGDAFLEVLGLAALRHGGEQGAS